MSISGPKRQRKKKTVETTVPLSNVNNLIPASVEHDLPQMIQGLLTQTQTVSQLAQKLINVAESTLPQPRNQLLQSFLNENQLQAEQSLNQLVEFVKKYISNQKKNTYAYQEKVFTSTFNVFSTENNPGKSQIQSLEQYAKDRSVGLINDYKICNIWYSLLSCFTAKTKPPSIKKSILFELFAELPKATDSLIELYHQSKLTELNYYSYLQIIFEKMDWFIALTEEYEALLILEIQSCLEKPDAYVLHTLAVRINRLIELYTNSSLLYASLLKEHKTLEIDQSLKRFIESVRPLIKLVKISEHVKNSTQSEELAEIYEELQNVVTLEQAIADTKEQAKSLGERKWLQLYSTLEQFYEQDWQKPLPTPLLNIESLSQKAKDLQTQLASWPKDSLNIKDTISITHDILAILKTYRTIDKAQLSKELIQQLIVITLSLLRLFNQDPELNSGFIGLTIQGLLNLVATDLLEDSKNVPSFVNQVQMQFSQLTLDEKPEEQQAKELTDLEFKHNQALAEESRKLAENERKHKEKRQVKFEKRKTDLDKNFHNELATMQKESAARKESLALEQNQQLVELKKQHDEKITKLKAAEEKSLLKIKENHAKKLQDLKVKQQSEVETLKVEYVKRVENLQTEHNSLFDAQKKTHADNISKLSDDHQSEMLSLNSKNASELLQLQESELQSLFDRKAAHKGNLDKLVENHKLKMEKLKKEYADKIASLVQKQQEQLWTIHNENEAELTLHMQKMEAELVVKSNSFQDELSAIKQKLPMQSIQGFQPIGHMNVSAEDQYILQDLLDEGIEVYIVGGKPRNALLGLPPSPFDDIDVMVNCSYDKLPAKFKLRAKQNPQESKQGKIGNIDFWCEPWTDLPAALKRRDFTINTFVAKVNGDIYDLLGYQSHIQSPFLHLIGDLRARFESDPSLMMRMLRFNTQLHKAIHPEDLKIMHACRHKIRTLPIGIYLKNLEHLFLSPLALKHFESINNNAMLFDILPITVNNFDALLTRRPLIYDFWQQILREYSQTEGITYYHILALFLLPGILQHNMNGKTLEQSIDDCLKDFFGQYKGETNENERLKLNRSVTSVIKDHTNQEVLGLFSQFHRFEVAASAFTPYKDAQSVPRLVKLSSISAQHTKPAKPGQ